MVNQGALRVPQVVVNGLGHAHGLQVIAHFPGQAVHLVGGVHGVIPADVKEIANVMGPHHFHNAAVIRLKVRLQFIPAGASRGGGRLHQQVQLRPVLVPQVKQMLQQHPLNAVVRCQHPAHLPAFKAGLRHPQQGGVDHRGGPA